MEGLVGQGKDFEFYPKCEEKAGSDKSNDRM